MFAGKLSASHLTLSISVLGLIVAKLFSIWHIEFTHFYLDVDRVFALILFLTAFFSLVEAIDVKALLALIAGALLSLWLATELHIASERAIQLFLMTALVEEILLRGVLFYLLLLRFNSIATLIISSVIFTLLHPSIYGDLLYTTAVFLTALLLGAVYLIFQHQYNRQIAIAIVTTLHAIIILLGINLGLLN